MIQILTASLVYIILITSPGEIEPARLLIDSIRSKAGEMSHYPIWVFEADSRNASCQSLQGPAIQVIPLEIPQDMKDYFFGEKIYACAMAEEMAGKDVQTLVWLNNEVLILKPPTQLILDSKTDVAIRPVLHRNIGSLKKEPLDEFWSGIYLNEGVSETTITVESFADGQILRPYYTTYIFSINPHRGIFRRWLQDFRLLATNQDFQAKACADQLHRIFLHQAVLSTIIARDINPERIRIMTPDYNYAYNLQKDIPADRKANCLNDLTTVVYEGRAIDPRQMTDISVNEPLRSWLIKHMEKED